jgi:hypothetical protein
MRIEYLIAPGRMESQNDGDVHYISAPVLARLYGLRQGQWRIYDPVTDRHSDLPVLGPRFDGNYALDGTDE